MTFAITVTFIIYMVLAITQDFEGGFDNIVGLAVIQPVMGAVLCSLTIIACLLVGLPIRLVRTINNWWTNHFAFGLGGIMLGITLLIISATPSFRQTVKATTEGVDQLKVIPNMTLSITGWFVTAFFALHIYPPKFIRTLLDKFISKIFPRVVTK